MAAAFPFGIHLKAKNLPHWMPGSNGQGHLQIPFQTVSRFPVPGEPAQIPCIGENGVWLWRPKDNSFECDPAITDDHLEVVHEARKLLRSLFQESGVIQQPGKTASVALYHPDTAYLRSIVPTITEEFQKRNWPLRVSMTWLYINLDQLIR